MAPPRSDLSPTDEAGSAEETPAARRRRTFWRSAGVATMLLVALFWIWAFTQSLRQADTPASSRNPDYLNDRAWVESAEGICDPVMAGIDERSRGAVALSAADRADDIDASSDDLRDMLDALADPPPESGADREVFDQWLADWYTHLDDRGTYAEAIRIDPDARFITTEKFNDQLESVIENFADVNGMPACGPAGDVG